jgi:hypothetical protein
MPKDHTKDTEDAIRQRHLERIQLEIQRFQAKVAQNTRDPDQFMTLMEMEGAMSELRHSTQKIYSDMLSDTLQSIDERPVVDKKNGLRRTRGQAEGEVPGVQALPDAHRAGLVLPQGVRGGHEG